MSSMCSYSEPRTTGLVVSVSDFGTRGPGSIPGWTRIMNCFFFLFSPCNTILLQTSELSMDYINDEKLNSLTFCIEISSKFVRDMVKFSPPER